MEKAHLDRGRRRICGLKKRDTLCPGFAMIETVAAIAIATLFTSYFLSSLLMVKRLYADYITDRNAQIIFRSLASYIGQNGALPYPAVSPSGHEIDHADSELDWEERAQDFMRGTLPYLTMGLDKSYVKDGYGTFFTYLVNPTLCKRKSIISVPPNDMRESLDYGSKGRSSAMISIRDGVPFAMQSPEPQNVWAGHVVPVIQRYSSYSCVRSYEKAYYDEIELDQNTSKIFGDGETKAWDIATTIPGSQITCYDDGQPIVLRGKFQLIPRNIPNRFPFHKKGADEGEKLLQAMRLDGTHPAGETTKNLSKYTVNDCIAVVLISHGKSRGGAFNDNGRIIAMPNGASREKVANGNQNSVKNICYLNKSRDSSGLFDDRVHWMSRFALPSIFGSFFCKPFEINTIVFDALENPYVQAPPGFLATPGLLGRT